MGGGGGRGDVKSFYQKKGGGEGAIAETFFSEKL